MTEYIQQKMYSRALGTLLGNTDMGRAASRALASIRDGTTSVHVAIGVDEAIARIKDYAENSKIPEFETLADKLEDFGSLNPEGVEKLIKELKKVSETRLSPLGLPSIDAVSFKWLSYAFAGYLVGDLLEVEKFMEPRGLYTSGTSGKGFEHRILVHGRTIEAVQPTVDHEYVHELLSTLTTMTGYSMPSSSHEALAVPVGLYLTLFRANDEGNLDATARHYMEKFGEDLEGSIKGIKMAEGLKSNVDVGNFDFLYQSRQLGGYAEGYKNGIDVAAAALGNGISGMVAKTREILNSSVVSSHMLTDEVRRRWEMEALEKIEQDKKEVRRLIESGKPVDPRLLVLDF